MFFFEDYKKNKRWEKFNYIKKFSSRENFLLSAKGNSEDALLVLYVHCILKRKKNPSNEACMLMRTEANAFIFHVVTVCLDDVTFEMYLPPKCQGNDALK